MNILILLIAWLCVWAGYNTSFNYRLKSLHDFRSLLPLAVLCAVFFIPINLFSPIGIMIIYTFIGLISSFFYYAPFKDSLWWGLAFLSPLIFITSLSSSQVYFIMNLNWIIASVISLVLIVNFLSQPGVLKNIKVTSFLCSGGRPFEGWLDVPHAKQILNMAWTRPTGLARYSSIASLVMLCLFVSHNTWYYFVGFAVFTIIMLFSKGKAEMVSFIVSMGFILFITNNFLGYMGLVYIIIIGICANIIFRISQLFTSNTFDTGQTVNVKNVKTSIYTLSGRTNGIWKQSILLIKKRPLFGYGFRLRKSQSLNNQLINQTTNSDGAIFTALLQSGIVGTVLFLIALVWTFFIAYHLLQSGHSLILLEACSVGIFIVLRGITQSFSLYSADWIFLVPVIAYLQIAIH